MKGLDLRRSPPLWIQGQDIASLATIYDRCSFKTESTLAMRVKWLAKGQTAPSQCRNRTDNLLIAGRWPNH